jgi:hypothetical protein
VRRGVHRAFEGKSEGKRTLWRPKSRWEDNIKMDIQEVRCEDMHRIEQAQDMDRWPILVKVVMHFRVP